MWGGLRAFSGPQCIYSTPLGVKSYCTRCLCLCLCRSLLLPAFPFLWVDLGKYLKTFDWGSQCDGALWLPLTGLSWLPSLSLAALSVYSGTFPTPIYCRVLLLNKCKTWGMKPFVIIKYYSFHFAVISICHAPWSASKFSILLVSKPNIF